MSAHIDWERFGKVLALLTSSHDGERLAAAERATQMLATAGMTWPDVARRITEAGNLAVEINHLRDQVRAARSYQQAAPPPPDDCPMTASEAAEIARHLYESGEVRGDFGEVLNSISLQFEAKGRLSLKQRWVVSRAWDRVSEKMQREGRA